MLLTPNRLRPRLRPPQLTHMLFHGPAMHSAKPRLGLHLTITTLIVAELNFHALGKQRASPPNHHLLDPLGKEALAALVLLAECYACGKVHFASLCGRDRPTHSDYGEINVVTTLFST